MMQRPTIVPLMEETMSQIVKTQAEVRPDDVSFDTRDHGDTAQVCGAVLCSKIFDPTNSRPLTPTRARALSDHHNKPSTDKGIPASERNLSDRSPSHKIAEKPTTTDQLQETVGSQDAIARRCSRNN